MPETARERGRRESGVSEYEHLRTKKKERRGNAERATVRSVFVGENRVVLTVEFSWTTDAERVEYDLDDDQDVLELEALTESQGFAFEQLGFLEGERLEMVYTGSGWIPNVQRAYADERAGASDSTATDSRPCGPHSRPARTPESLRRLIRTAQTMTTTQLLVAVIIVKKLIIVAMLAWLLL